MLESGFKSKSGYGFAHHCFGLRYNQYPYITLILFPGPFTCIRCRQPILDQRIYQIQDEYCIHESCLQCSECGIRLSSNCYAEPGGLDKLYCEQHAAR